jgi:hypothetical protein
MPGVESVDINIGVDAHLDEPSAPRCELAWRLVKRLQTGRERAGHCRGFQRHAPQRSGDGLDRAQRPAHAEKLPKAAARGRFATSVVQ